MGGGGQKGTSTTINQAQPQPDPTIQPLLQSSANKFLEAQQGAPSLLSLLTPTPQRIPGMNALEQFFMSQQMALGGPQGGSLDPMAWATSPELDALKQIGQMTSGPVGSSPATKEGIAALETQYQNETLPSIQNQLQLAGLGHGGALGESLSRARSGVSASTVPLIQQEMVDRMNAVNQLAGLGGTLAQRQRGDIQNALTAAGTPREIETQQAQAEFLDQQRQQALIEQLVMGPLNIFGPSLIGQGATTAQDFATRGGGIWKSLIGGGAK